MKISHLARIQELGTKLRISKTTKSYQNRRFRKDFLVNLENNGFEPMKACLRVLLKDTFIE